MTFTLENNTIIIKINELGAELSSLKTKHNNLEFIWEADPEVWARHAPVLFPIVGKLKNDSYSYEGVEYKLPQHGFARDKEFKKTNHDDNSITFQLVSDPETLKVFPFHFELNTTYILDGNKLVIQHVVKNPAFKSMYFSIGAHPGFRCPILNEDFEDYYLEFDREEDFIRHKIKGGLISGEQEDLQIKSNIIPLQKDLFKEDALVFKSIRSKRIILKNKRNHHQVEMSIEGFPYLGIWTKLQDNANFICIEPWLGIADHQDTSGDFTQKEGIIKLDGLQQYICSYSIEVQ